MMWKGPKKKKKQLNKEHKKVQLQKKGRERQNVCVSWKTNKDMQKNQERKESGIPGSSPKSNLVDGSGTFSLCFFF